MQAVEAAAAAAGAELLRRGRDWDVAETPTGLRLAGLDLPRPALLGAHQAENAGIAIGALRAAGFDLPAAALAAGLQKAEWPARLQRLTGRCWRNCRKVRNYGWMARITLAAPKCLPPSLPPGTGRRRSSSA